MVSVASSGNTLWICDPCLVSFALELLEMLRSHDYRHKFNAPKQCASSVFSFGTIRNFTD